MKAVSDEEKEWVRVARALMSTQEAPGWRECVRHVMPELLGAGDLEGLPDDGLPQAVCERAVTGVLKLASAHSVMITPRGLNWFSYDAGDEGGEERSDDEKDWFTRVSQITQAELEHSNFYAEGLSAIIDRIATGTGLLLTEADERSRGLVFTHVPMGTFRLAENRWHEVDTVCRVFKFTAHQAEMAFGAAALDEDMRAALRDSDRRFKSEFEIWHLTVPSRRAGRGNGRDAKNPRAMMWASVYIAVGSEEILKVDGYEEFPYMATRFLKYGNQVYGRSALRGVKEVIGRYLEVEAAMAEGAKAAVYPRLLSTPDMVGRIDLRAGGVTVLSKQAVNGGLPREWAAAGRYDAGVALLQRYDDAIDNALFVNQLQSVSNVERQMSATEARLRENEKLMTFSQTFTQFACDFRPLMARVFCILWRWGKFPAVGEPRDIFEPVGPDNRGVKVLAPGVKYLGRLSKALESAKQEGLQEALLFGLQLAEATGDEAWMDYFKPYECMKFITDESNVDVGCLRSSQEAKGMRKSREDAAQAQMQLEAAKQLTAMEAASAQAAAK